VKESLTAPDLSHNLPPALRRLVQIYLLLALAFAVLIPLWEAPDAIWHYHFITHLADGNGLPKSVDEGEVALWRQEGSQPPLYYLLTAPLVAPIDRSDEAEIIRFNPHAAVGSHGPGGNINRMVHGSWEDFPWRGTVLAARLIGFAGVFMGLVALLATWAGASALFPKHPSVALATSAFVVLNPEFLFFAGAVSNDIMITMAGALVFWRWAIVLRNGASDRNAAWLGVAGGIAMLSKLSGLWLLPPAVLALVWAVWMEQGKEKEKELDQLPVSARLRAWARGSLRPLGIFSLTLFLVAGWWYLRNLILFGDPTGLPLMLNIMHARSAPPGPRELSLIMTSVWRSYWAVFGWFNLPAPDWVFHVLTGGTILGLARLGWVLVKDRKGRRERKGVEAPPRVDASSIDEVGRAGLAISLVAVLFMIAAVIAWAHLQYPQGRLALPAAPALGLLLGAERIAWIIALGLGGLSLWLLVNTIRPAYVSPAGDHGAGLSFPFASRACFGEDLCLVPWAGQGSIGDELDKLANGTLLPGGHLRLRLAWRPSRILDRDLSIFLHLLDEDGQIIAQRDSYPQSGRLPSRDWIGRIPSLRNFGYAPGWIDDEQILQVPSTHATSCECRLFLGVYDAAIGERLLVSDVDEESGFAVGFDGAAIELGRVRIAPTTDDDGTPNPLSVPFGERIELAGYALDRRAARPSEPISLTLHWRALGVPKGDYKISVQIRDAAGHTIAQRDEEPADGDADTDKWRRGDRIVDGQPLTVHADAPPGDYRIFIAMYDQVDGKRLPVNWRDEELDLGPFKVLAP
jgi:hypothetical protein